MTPAQLARTPTNDLWRAAVADLHTAACNPGTEAAEYALAHAVDNLERIAERLVAGHPGPDREVLETAVLPGGCG